MDDQMTGAMDFEEFEARAREIYDQIPPEYREGVDGLEVLRSTVPHPSLPEVYTLGECKSEFYPSEFGGAGEVRSIVALYYGSFLALSRTQEGWDWEGELWETITHEVRHHLESLATEDALEVQDYAEDQNFARREGAPFDPFYYRSGNRLEGDAFEIDGDVFLERSVDPRGLPGEEIVVAWAGEEVRIPPPEPLGDVHFVRLVGVGEGPGEVFLVLVRRRGLRGWLRGLLRGSRLEVLESDVGEDE